MQAYLLTHRCCCHSCSDGNEKTQFQNCTHISFEDFFKFGNEWIIYVLLRYLVGMYNQLTEFKVAWFDFILF